MGTVTTIISSLCFVIQKLDARAFFFHILALNLLQTEPSLSPVSISFLLLFLSSDNQSSFLSPFSRIEFMGFPSLGCPSVYAIVLGSILKILYICNLLCFLDFCWRVFFRLRRTRVCCSEFGEWDDLGPIFSFLFLKFVLVSFHSSNYSFHLNS